MAPTSHCTSNVPDAATGDPCPWADLEPESGAMSAVTRIAYCGSGLSCTDQFIQVCHWMKGACTGSP